MGCRPRCGLRAWSRPAARQMAHGILAVAVLSSVALGQYPTLRIRAQAPIGESGANDALVASARGIAIDSAGDIYVLDGGDRDVKVFDVAGRYVRRFAGPGAGPGELMRPLSIALRSGTVVVSDAVNGDVLFERSGRHLGTVGPSSLQDRSIRVRGGGRLWQEGPIDRLTGPDVSAPRDRDYALVYKGPSDSARTIFRYPSDLAQYRTAEGRTVLLPSGFGNGGAWSLLGDSAVIIADGHTGRLARYSVSRSGRLSVVQRDSIRALARSVSGADRTSAAARIAARTGSFGRATVARVSRPGQLLDGPTRWSVASQVIPDTEGRGWIGAPRLISRFEADGSARQLTSSVDGNVWYRFAPSGVDAMVSLPSNFQLRAVVGTCFLGLDLDREVAGVLRYCLVQ